MVRFRGGLLLFPALTLAAPANDLQQHVLDITPARVAPGAPRELQGRFLHITDFHPDPFYKSGTNPSGDHPCHAGEGKADYYGAYLTECDSPFSLVNATFDWIKENLKDEIDFILWTGDSARHDNDEDIPRSNQLVEDLNKFMVHKFVEVFGKTDNINDPDPTNDFVIPIVPTFGNNDILPHNILEPGPNRWTRKYIDIWNRFVPEAQKHSFARGGWFFTEVIPNKLAVFSINSLYFFDSNSAVDGCDLESEPGYEHMEWLRIQLEFLRDRKMKAILMGHVPPLRTGNKQSWDESCYQKYTLWMRLYRDVIVGNIYGHVNVDHFMLQDVRDLTYKFKFESIQSEGIHPEGRSAQVDNVEDFHPAVKPDYLNDLRDRWSELPTPPKGISYTSGDLTRKYRNKKKQSQIDKFLKEIGGPWGERFSLTLVSPSVVPNYFPSLRVIEYNITGLDGFHPKDDQTYIQPVDKSATKQVNDARVVETDELDDEAASEDEGDNVSTDKKKKKHKKGGKKKKKKKPKANFPVPLPPSKSAPPGPAYSPQTFSFLSMTQYYANLTEIHEKMNQDLAVLQREQQNKLLAQEDLLMQKKQNYFKYKIEYATNNDTFYKMKDLTIPSWLDLAEKIGRTTFSLDEYEDIEHIDEDDLVQVNSTSEIQKHRKGSSDGDAFEKNRLWHAFVKRAYVGAKTDKNLQDEFG